MKISFSILKYRHHNNVIWLIGNTMLQLCTLMHFFPNETIKVLWPVGCCGTKTVFHEWLTDSCKTIYSPTAMRQEKERQAQNQQHTK